MTVDMENWHGVSCAPVVPWLLDQFDRHGARATFFCVGARARQLAPVIRQVSERGHEIASHCFNHSALETFTPDAFACEVRESLDVLTDITGLPVHGFRMPFFSLTRKHAWAWQVLAELGLAYDSSVLPARAVHYGDPGFPRYPVRIDLDGSSIVEVPLSTVRLARRAWPTSGGGYFRLLPYAAIRRAVEAAARDGVPFVAYCHPYEFDVHRLCYVPDQASSAFRARMDEIRSNARRGTMRGKLARLVGDFRFTSIHDCLENEIDA